MTIHERIALARPRLKRVAPLTNAVYLIYSFTNLLIGYGLYITRFGTTTRGLVVVNSVLTFKFYGALFFFLGLFMLYAHYKNNWRVMKLSLLGGLFVKSVWVFALAYSMFNGGSIPLFALWLAFTGIQAATYIYFIPRIGAADGQ